MAVNIPLYHREGIVNLITLSDADADRLFDALGRQPPTLLPQVLGQRTAEASGLATDRVTPIVKALLSLITTRDEERLTSDQVATDIANEAAAQKLGNLQPESPTVAAFRDRLTRFLSLEQPLWITARAANVMIQHKNALRSSRILSDIRAIFSSGDDPEPVAAVIVHNLQLTTIADGDYCTFIAALDTQDLRSLAAVIARAIKKEERLKTAIHRAGLSYIDILPTEVPINEINEE
jgi:hypothetical protein